MNPLDLSDDAPWKKRFRAPAMFTSMAALNPERGIVITNRDGIYQIYAWDVPSGDLRQITDMPAGSTFGGISPDGRYIYYHHDKQGDEVGHYVRVPFDGGIDSPRENLTPNLPAFGSWSLSESLNGRLIGMTAAANGAYSILTVPVAEDGSLGEPRLLYRTQALSFGPALSYDGNYAAIATTERSGTMDFAIMAMKLDDPGDEIRAKVLQEQEGSAQAIGFAPIPGDTRLLASTNVTGFDRPLIWDIESNDRIDLPLHDIPGNVRPLGWSPDGKRILLEQLNQAVHQLYIYDLDRSTLTPLNHPPGSYNGAYFMPGDSDEIVAHWEDATHPPYATVLDGATGAVKRHLLRADESPSGQPWRSVSFTSSGGATIQAWVCTPEGDGPWPLILHTHGGPTSVQTEVYGPSAQAWVDHGFAWMSVNYRGSTTFGRDFEYAIHGMLGFREVDDMVAAREWAIQNGIALPDSILLTGGSYGGYLTLQALGRKPELWAGGMAEVAIADWRVMYEDQTEALRGYQKALFGGTPDDLPKITRNSSPIRYVDAVEAPVLIIQGENDTRTPARQIREYEAQMQDAGKDITVHWFNAGHGSRAVEQNIEHMTIMLRWAYRVLG